MKILLSLIVTSSLFSAPLLPLSIKQLISMYSSLRGTPFHPDIKITNTDENKNSQSGNLNHSVKETYPGYTSITWTNYANSWEQFKQYYKTITLYTNGYVDGKSASKNTFGYTYITVANIEQRSSWHSNDTLRASGSSYCLAYTSHNFQWGSYDQAGVYYDAIVSGSSIQIRFYLWTKAYQYGSGSIWTEAYIKYTGGIISSSWNLNTIKNNLTNALSNTINLVSDYSGSLEDKRNITDPTGKGNDETTKINSIIAKVLGTEYSDWQQYIQPYAFSDANRTATVTFKFLDPVSKQQVVWPFTAPVNITLSKNYWSKSLRERLHIMPGQIVNPQDSTKGMVPDTGIQLEPSKVTDNYGGNIQYHTTAHIEFDGLSDSSEWMTVNGKPVQVLNNKFIYDMTDERVEQGSKATNVYDIIVYHDDGVYKSQYEIKYTIDNLVPTLKEKWYAWDPQNNPDQNVLIQPTIDGKTNPKYDKEVNPDTGTKTQILWVKRKSDYPFPLDPLNKDGEVIDPTKNPEDYDLGFLAEGSVAGMGVQQLFDSSQVDKVLREGVDNNLNAFPTSDSKQKLTTIVSDTDNKYWSWEGFWHYVTKTADGLAYEKYVLIGAQYQDKYPRFLDVLNNANIAVDFWTTIHGVHLKNYLATYKNLDSSDISKLSFEQVASYWKEYTSDVIAQRIPPDPQPANYVDITGVLSEVKLNERDVLKIRDTVDSAVNSYITKKSAQAKLNTDYFIYTPDGKDINVDASGLDSLLNNQTDPQYLKLTIKAATTSTLLIGTASVQVRNSTHYDPTKADDLSKIKFDNYSYNFQDFDIVKIRNWILNNVQNYLTKYNYLDITLNVDYGISGNGIPEQDPVTHHNTPGDLSDSLLQKFLDTTQGKTNLLITVYADDASDLAVGSSEFSLINDPGADPAPPDPPIPPIPTPKPTPKANQKYLAWLLPLTIGTAGAGIGIYFYIHNKRKRGIGGKKRTKIKKENNHE
ncbi:Mbov_0399 family ICE element protein [Spiroplasma sp. DGKH1]|uniref:Mbov_0399 family ICE element protein n=1 Tax=Spiroplasma sp. DGKH1 TaxID=3050074 RepID=UPI0034C61949